MTTYEKIVKGGTKLKLAAPKTKYIEPILIVTHSARDIDDEDFRVIMKTLATRIQDTAWTVSFKSFLIIHIMIREGEGDLTLQYLSQHLKMMDPKNAPRASVSMTGFDIKALKTYSKYLAVKAKEYGLTKIDYVRDERLHNAVSKNPESGGRLRRLSVDKGVLREVESVQRQIDALLRCKYQESEVNNDVILTAFRMLVHDLLSLYQSLNEGVINLLEHYFEMSKFDAERSLDIYKVFVDQTKDVVAYLRIAKRLEYATKLHVPTIKHAPTALANSLEEYLNDPDFEMNRRQYLAEKEGKKITGSSANLVRNTQAYANVSSQPAPEFNQGQQSQPQNVQTQPSEVIMQQQSGFNPWGFSSFLGNTVTPQQLAVSAVFQTQTQPQQSQFTSQPSQVVLPQQTFTFSSEPNTTNNVFSSQTNGFTNSFNGSGQLTDTGAPPNLIPIQKTGITVEQSNLVPLQQTATGLGSQQVTSTPLLNQQSTGFFSQRPNSMITPSFTGAGFRGYGAQSLQQQTTGNPFETTPQLNRFSTAFSSSSNSQQQPLQPHYTSTQTSLKRSQTNPFAMGSIRESETEPDSKQVDPTTNPFSSIVNKSKTVSLQEMHTGTNPFRSDAFTTGQLLLRPQLTAGGLERLPTIPVFPETQKDAKDQQLQLSASYQLEQQKLILQQQLTGFQQQQFAPAGFQQQQTGFQQQQTGFAQSSNGFPQQQTGYLQQQNGYPQQQTGYPQQQAGFPQQQTGYTQQQSGFPQQQTGFQQPQLL